ncbi:MAG TPA: flagellar biosynthesis anti-sigma factor FlgM [Dehalococcoidia bacterium]
MQIQQNSSNVTSVEVAPHAVNAPSGAKAARRPQTEAPEARADQVEISTRARALQQADQAAREAPEVREDRVRELREAIQNGTYRVDAKAVAERLLDAGHL